MLTGHTTLSLVRRGRKKHDASRIQGHSPTMLPLSSIELFSHPVTRKPTKFIEILGMCFHSLQATALMVMISAQGMYYALHKFEGLLVNSSFALWIRPSPHNRVALYLEQHG